MVRKQRNQSSSSEHGTTDQTLASNSVEVSGNRILAVLYAALFSRCSSASSSATQNGKSPPSGYFDSLGPKSTGVPYGFLHSGHVMGPVFATCSDEALVAVTTGSGYS
jgi:hypothetical protein